MLSDPGNAHQIFNWPVTQSFKDVDSIIGMVNYYQQFIEDYSKKLWPLVELTKMERPFEWIS